VETPGLFCIRPLASPHGDREHITMRDPSPPDTQLRLRLRFGSGAMLGPGRADLLQGIADTGSISAAGRAMGMSYRRAWSLIETLNAAFATPLVDSVRGGPGGGGARLTDAGVRVLYHYRQLASASLTVGAEDIAAIRALLRQTDMSERK
jgi:molybdate transport system regulatory protein